MAEELTCAGGDVNNASSTSMPCLDLLEGERHLVKLATEANVMSALDRLSLLPLTGGTLRHPETSFLSRPSFVPRNA